MINLPHKKIYLFVLLLGFLALLILPSIAIECIWFDEFYSVTTASMEIPDMIATTAVDAHPPLYYLLLGFWMDIFGISEWAIRLPSLLFGIMTLFLTYAFAKKLFDENTAMLATGLLTISNMFVWAVSEARSYAMLMFISTLSFYYFYNFTKTSSRKNFFLLAIINSVLFYTHIYSIFIILSQNIYFLFFHKNKFKVWLYLQLTILFLALPWVIIEFFQFIKIKDQNESNSWFIQKPSIGIIMEYLTYYFGSKYILFVSSHIIFIALMKKFRKKIKLSKSSVFIAFWVFPTLIVPVLLSFYLPIFIPRYVSFLIVPATIILAHVIFSFKNKFIIFFLIIILTSFSLSNIYTTRVQNYQKPNWKEVSRYMHNLADPSDLHIYSAAYNYYAFNTYYKSNHNYLFVDNTEIIDDNIFKINDSAKIWYIIKESLVDIDFITTEIEKTHKEINTINFDNITIILFIKK